MQGVCGEQQYFPSICETWHKGIAFQWDVFMTRRTEHRDVGHWTAGDYADVVRWDSPI